MQPGGFGLDAEGHAGPVEDKVEVKGGGPECSPHTGTGQ
jgi:hypothetical protein